jgi:hypothetical protein
MGSRIAMLTPDASLQSSGLDGNSAMYDRVVAPVLKPEEFDRNSSTTEKNLTSTWYELRTPMNQNIDLITQI